MTSRSLAPLSARCAKSLSGLGLLALLATVGCGASARSDFDVNRGAPENIDTGTMEAAKIREVFPLMGDPADSTWTYHIYEGDNLEIAFFSHPEQNRFVTVRPDGRISLPYVGEVMAAGKRPSDLANELQTDYSEVLVSPRVDVIVQQMGARFYVVGHVNNPGEFAYDRRLDVMQAIGRAGGFTTDARLTNIVLIRTDVDGRSYAAIFDFREFMDAQSRLSPLALRPADVVWVPRSSLSRWDDNTRRLFSGLGVATRAGIDAWSLVNFTDVYERRFD